MRYWMWTAFVAILTFVFIRYTQIPLWMFLVIAAPVLTILLIYASFLYSFRQSLKMEAVPTHGYDARIQALDQAARSVEALGFQKIDQFYLKMIPDSVTYVFKHQHDPCYFCLYHLGQKMTCDVVTRFENEFYLTTSDSVDAGMTPRPKKALLQIFPGQSYQNLFLKHKEAYEYIDQNGIHTFDFAGEEFRYYFMKSLREQEAYIRKTFFWPLMLLIRTVSRHGRIYCRSIRDQYPRGFSSLFLQRST
jgi:hypothetical protein